MEEGQPQVMATKAQVATRRPVVGVEFDPSLFQAAVTPEVVIPEELDSLKVSSGEITNLTATNAIIPKLDGTELSNVKVNNVEFTGSLVGLPAAQPIVLDEVANVSAASPDDLSTLQYNGSLNEWQAVANTDFIDSIIDGGEADSDPDYVAAFDIDGGNA
jgi:hypothetical protein